MMCEYCSSTCKGWQPHVNSDSLVLIKVMVIANDELVGLYVIIFAWCYVCAYVWPQLSNLLLKL